MPASLKAIEVPLAPRCSTRSTAAQTRQPIRRDAVLSACGTYRYSLTREWSGGPRMLFVMLNPSTADASVDDPTIRRCISFARREGMGAIDVVNVFAFRTTSPKVLFSAGCNIVGPDNQEHVRRALARASRVVVAWGAHPVSASPIPAVIAGANQWRWCLGTTRDGSPRHPLYVRDDQPLVLWPVSEVPHE